MSDLATAITVLVLVVLAVSSFVLRHILRDWAEDREREERYATEWQETHKRNQENR